jgi:DNA polymerase III alpha subunit
MPDIDIDFADRDRILSIIQHVPAALKDKKGMSKHKTGIYCHAIPVNPLLGTASIDYKEAERRGYFKIDFLNVGIYQGVKDEDHLKRLMDTEPLWDLLLEDEFTNKLFHVNGHGELLRKMKPGSVEELAMVLAMIRPAKRYLAGKPWDEVKQEIWIKPSDDEYFFKKSHAIAYAHAIVVQMNLICEQLSHGHG